MRVCVCVCDPFPCTIADCLSPVSMQRYGNQCNDMENNVLIENVKGYVGPIPGVTVVALQPQGKEPGQRDKTKNHSRLGGIRQNRDLFKVNLQRDNICVPPPIWCRDLDATVTNQPMTYTHRTNLRPHRLEWNVCSTSHTHARTHARTTHTHTHTYSGLAKSAM